LSPTCTAGASSSELNNHGTTEPTSGVTGLC
jgi:hypothetical protein